MFLNMIQTGRAGAIALLTMTMGMAGSAWGQREFEAGVKRQGNVEARHVSQCAKARAA